MNLGKLDRRITLEVSTATQNDYGEAIAAWSPLGMRWARREDLGGSEDFEASELVAIHKVRYTLRYEKLITARLRVRDGDQVFDIDNVAEIGRRHGLKLTAYTRNEPLERTDPAPPVESATYTSAIPV